MLFEKTHKNDRTRHLPHVYQSVVLSHASPNARHLPFKNSCLPGITSILTINTGLMTKSTQGRHKPCDYLGTLVIISSLRGQESTRNRPGRPRSSGPHPPGLGPPPSPSLPPRDSDPTVFSRVRCAGTLVTRWRVGVARGGAVAGFLADRGAGWGVI